MKIAIVGFGISGAALLMSLKTSGKLNECTHIDIFDPNDEPAVGLAYGKDSKHLLLNAFPTAMSLNPENKFEFSDWLAKHYPEYDSLADLVPRTIYGEYASERLTPLLTEEKVTHHKVEIIDTHVIKHDATILYDLKDSNGIKYDGYDYLFLALGAPPYKDFYNLEGVENYIHQPYPVLNKLAAIDNDTKIAIIGSGLTAFDLVNYLSHEKELEHKIGVFTNVPNFNSLRVPPYKGAALSYSLDDEWIENEYSLNEGFIPLDCIIEAIKHDLTHNRINLSAIRKIYDPANLKDTYHTYKDKEHPELSKFQAYIALLSGYLGDFYMSLSKDDQVRYHLDYAPLFSHYQVRLAPDAVSNMYQLMDKEQLFVVPDLIQIETKGEFVLQSKSGDTYLADIVINASGFDYSIDRIGEYNRLLSKLLDKGLLLDKDKRGILVTWPECQIVNQRYGRLDTLFYIGPWLSNTHYGNNNVKALVQKAYDIVSNYMNIQ